MIHFREDIKLWWPDHDMKPEKSYPYIMGRIADMDMTIRRCKKHDVVLQAGGFNGMWPMRLAKYFKRVISFEPDGIMYHCAIGNTTGIKNIEMHNLALGASPGVARMELKGPGSSCISDNGGLEVEMITVDSLELAALDALILDVEAYEVEVLRGAKKTIAKHRPVIHVELLPRSAAAIDSYLNSIGYKKVDKIHNDAVYVS